MFTVSSSDLGISFAVKVQPGASRTLVQGLDGDFLKIRLKAPPVDGKANEALIEILAKELEVPKSWVKIRSGLWSRRKIVQVNNCTELKLRRFLEGL